MFRRITTLALAAGILTFICSCRHSCGSSASSAKLASNSKANDICYDAGTGYPIGMPVSGSMGEYPGTLIPGNGVPMLPAPGGVAPNELPYPQPSGNIPPAGVPFAPPTTAPGDTGPNASLPMPRAATPVKNDK